MKNRTSRAWGFVDSLELPLLILVLIVVLILLSPPNSPIPGRDEGVFVYVGQQILHGRIPYRDVWDHKGPLIYYLDALGLVLSQNGLWGIWLIEGLIITASLILFYRLMRRELTGGPAMFGILTWLTGFTIVMGGNIVEEFAIPLVIASLHLVLYNSRFSLLYAGVLAGFAFMLRPNEVAAPVMAFLFLLSDQAGRHSRQRILRALWHFGVGFVAVAGACAAYFAWNHALDDLFRSVFLFNYYYVAQGGNVLLGLLSGMAYLIIPVLFSVACLLCALFLRVPVLTGGQKKLLYFAIGLLILTLPLSLLSGRAYRHYYIPWLVPLSIFSAYFCFFLRQSQIHSSMRKALWIAAWSVLAISAILGVRIRAVPLLAGGTNPDEAQAILSIRGFVPENKRLLIWGNETGYAVMAGRTLASRYVYLAPLLVPGYGEQAALVMLADIKDSRPIIIDTSATDPDIPSLKHETPPYPYLAVLYAFIHENYSVIGFVAQKRWAVWGPK